MSSLIVEVCDIKEIKKHNSADKLEIAIIKGWECIVPKGRYKAGDHIVYIPIDAVLPIELADKLGVRNYLRGPNKDRVGCAQIRGRMSYGLVIENSENFELGTDVAAHYGITKYLPPFRAFCGDCAADDSYFEKMADVENINNYPDTFVNGQMVAVTEKIDGTQSRIGVSQVDFEIEDERGLFEIYKIGENGEDSVYAVWKAGSNEVIRKRSLIDEELNRSTYWFPYTLDSVYDFVEYMIFEKGAKHVQLLGEIIGGGISGGAQSLNYGVTRGFAYRAFGIKIDHVKINYKQFKEYCVTFGIPTVPEVAIMPYDFDAICALSQGNSLLAEANGVSHIREGVVVCPYEEDGLAIAKFLNPDYLLLKDSGKIKDFTDN